MNTEAANKLLKLLEEPPQKTVLILIAVDKSALLDTIVSRCQLLEIPSLSEEQIAQALIQQKNADYPTAREIARQANGNYNTALQVLQTLNESHPFEDWTIKWIRTAFRVKENKTVINELLQWAEEIAGAGRETQKKFLDYCIEFFGKHY